jgi:hypothetical protein
MLIHDRGKAEAVVEEIRREEKEERVGLQGKAGGPEGEPAAEKPKSKGTGRKRAGRQSSLF